MVMAERSSGKGRGATAGCGAEVAVVTRGRLAPEVGLSTRRPVAAGLVHTLVELPDVLR